MTSLEFDEGAIPSLQGKVAIITGGASGIGFAAAKTMLAKEATVHILDVNEPDSDDDEASNWREWPRLHFHKCNVADWADLRAVIDAIGPFHLAFANAGVAEKSDYFADTWDESGRLELPSRALLDVNLFGALHTVKLAWSSMRRHGIRGSIVVTASTTGYAPEAALPVYSMGKTALVGLVRALRHRTVLDGITINAVAPAGTRTPLIAEHVGPLSALGVPFSSAHFVGVALVYSATASQERRVEPYGKEHDADIWRAERWNGRIIYVLGDRYTELEEAIADLRPFWFGRENLRLTRSQQAMLDMREGVDAPRE
ncbi:Uu.00g004960.m01.CDS01 [Anthostomella pinea]|uniref:Uu.00g004960.m01.CDS01 n=1 Tax=Anthostomella pinea TaxID=933095 RepID=A0AAI8VK18_9PEZI|nr:Uu.00g004960.m01.CDS01 [Anthostomella pinea]